MSADFNSSLVTCHSPLARRERRAFTLIELLVVIGVIALLAGGIGLALGGRGGDGVALTSAQSVLSGLVGATRAEAALHQTSARLLVYAAQPPNGSADKYLRYLQIVREEPFGSGKWVAAGDAVTLPAPVCVVPPAPVPASHLATGVTWNNNVATGPVSTLVTPPLRNFSVLGQTGATTGQLFGGAGGGSAYYLEFAPDGTVAAPAASGSTKLALTTAVLATNALPQFNNASAVRGLLVRKTGATSLVTDASGF